VARFAKKAVAQGFVRLPFTARRAAACSAWKLAKRSNKRSCRLGIVSLYPTADQAAGSVKHTRGEFIALASEQSEIGGESQQEPQFLYPQICTAQMLIAFSGIGCINERFENVEADRSDPIAHREFVVSRKFLDGHQHPRDKPVMCFDGRPGLSCIIDQGKTLKNIDQGLRPWTPGVKR
jgi:hypothetical protein